MRSFGAIALAGLLAVAGPSSAQMALTGAGSSKAVAASGRTCTDDTASTNFLARTSALSNREQDAYCFLIKDLETASIITGNLSGATGCGSIAAGIYFLATKNTTTAALNICGTSFGLTTHGTPASFTADTGYVGDASTFYLDTSYIPSSSGGPPTQNSMALSVYMPNSRTASQSWIGIGASTAGGGYDYLGAEPAIAAEINGDTFPTTANSNAQGAWGASRTASTGFSVYQNNNLTPIATYTDASVAMPISSIILFGFNDNISGPSDLSGDLISGAGIFSGLTAAQSVAVNNAFNHAIATVNPGLNIY